MKIVIKESPTAVGSYVGANILQLVKHKKQPVIGFATGSSPLTTYEYLVTDYAQHHTDWSQVITFNLDEYVGLTPSDPRSYYAFMHQHLFNHLNIASEHIHIPDGINLQINDNYDQKIKQYGAIDYQILGVGLNGHIGFNEPPCNWNSQTRLVDLTESTINANSVFFAQKADVPHQAISMGIKSIMHSKKIVLIALGEHKAEIVHQLVTGQITKDCPASVLQLHPCVEIVVDQLAATKLA